MRTGRIATPAVLVHLGPSRETGRKPVGGGPPGARADPPDTGAATMTWRRLRRGGLRSTTPGHPTTCTWDSPTAASVSTSELIGDDQVPYGAMAAKPRDSSQCRSAGDSVSRWISDRVPRRDGSGRRRHRRPRRRIVCWAEEGRSPETGRRAGAAGLRGAGTLAGLVEASEMTIPGCPPHAALEAAGAVVRRPRHLVGTTSMPTPSRRPPSDASPTSWPGREPMWSTGGSSVPRRGRPAGPASTCRGQVPEPWPAVGRLGPRGGGRLGPGRRCLRPQTGLCIVVEGVPGPAALVAGRGRGGRGRAVAGGRVGALEPGPPWPRRLGGPVRDQKGVALGGRDGGGGRLSGRQRAPRGFHLAAAELFGRVPPGCRDSDAGPRGSACGFAWPAGRPSESPRDRRPERSADPGAAADHPVQRVTSMARTGPGGGWRRRWG